MTGRADDIPLCVSELASNVVEHGTRTTGDRGVFLVRIDADDAHVRVEVEDDDPIPMSTPRVSRADDGDTSGRGMMIMASPAIAWGFESCAFGGKAVWSEFLTAPAGPGRNTAGPTTAAADPGTQGAQRPTRSPSGRPPRRGGRGAGRGRGAGPPPIGRARSARGFGPRSGLPTRSAGKRG
ncbi:ATP-binding protein [Streptomyces vinaceus]|uniref:ATP-binding protein n=1 Tax=Streptomyces vinaceus TaxID=1960 RepID=UPI00369D53EA